MSETATVESTPTTQPTAPAAPPSTTAASGTGTSPSQTQSGASSESAASTSTTETTSAPASTSPEWWATIDSIDPKELLKHPKVAGTLGDLAQRRAQDERRKWDSEQAQKAEADRLRNLRDNDPALYVEEEKRLEAERGRHEQAQGEILGDLHSFFQERFTQLPQDEQKRLAGKNWGNGVAGFRAAMAEFDEIMTSQRTKAEVEKSRTQWEKEARTAMREAVRKEVLAEVNGKEPAADTGGGQSAPGALTSEEFERNRGDATWRRSNKERVNSYLASMPVRKR